jgi:hypothetical protein
MSTDLHGFPFWTLQFDKDASPVDAAALDTFVDEVAGQSLTDLYIFSHGWNNESSAALSLYDKYFAEVRKIVDARAVRARIGVAGVIWPSILWPDDAAASARTDVVAPAMSGGAVSMGSGPPPPLATASLDDVHAALNKGYEAPGQQRLLADLIALLAERKDSDEALQKFQQTLGQLLASERAGAAADKANPDAADGAVGLMPYKDFRRLLDTMGHQMPQPAGGGAAGLVDGLAKLWDGAKDVLRVGTYWQMKERAGIVGRAALGPLITRLHERVPATRVHLIGHSFGARLVSNALAGLPATAMGAASPVKSLLLLQGAFSHFAFADVLPQDHSRSGALKGMAARVDGPLLATHSLRDLAVGRSYPAASFVNRDDSAAAQDQASRWGGMGSDGAQAVDALRVPLGDVGTVYPFQAGKWINLDGNQVIIHGGLPSGAHSDIVHPHTAWLTLAAAKLV